MKGGNAMGWGQSSGGKPQAELGLKFTADRRSRPRCLRIIDRRSIVESRFALPRPKNNKNGARTDPPHHVFRETGALSIYRSCFTIEFDGCDLLDVRLNFNGS